MFPTCYSYDFWHLDLFFNVSTQYLLFGGNFELSPPCYAHHQKSSLTHKSIRDSLKHFTFLGMYSFSTSSIFSPSCFQLWERKTGKFTHRFIYAKDLVTRAQFKEWKKTSRDLGRYFLPFYFIEWLHELLPFSFLIKWKSVFKPICFECLESLIVTGMFYKVRPSWSCSVKMCFRWNVNQFSAALCFGNLFSALGWWPHFLVV